MGFGSSRISSTVHSYTKLELEKYESLTDEELLKLLFKVGEKEERKIAEFLLQQRREKRAAEESRKFVWQSSLICTLIGAVAGAFFGVLFSKIL